MSRDFAAELAVYASDAAPLAGVGWHPCIIVRDGDNDPARIDAANVALCESHLLSLFASRRQRPELAEDGGLWTVTTNDVMKRAETPLLALTAAAKEVFRD